MHLNLGSILQASAQARPDHVAIRLGEQSLRYRELDRAARGVAAGLRARGLAAGDRVCAAGAEPAGLHDRVLRDPLRRLHRGAPERAAAPRPRSRTSSRIPSRAC